MYRNELDPKKLGITQEFTWPITPRGQSMDINGASLRKEEAKCTCIMSHLHLPMHNIDLPIDLL